MAIQTSTDLRERSARDRILLTAHDLFYEHGIRATGIDRVIAEAGVTKVTFYRHFPSKNDLILSFLAHRHERWMSWFISALERHGGHRGKGIDALVLALGEWFADPGYRGCAFLNSVGELGATLPEVRDIARSHKVDMAVAIAHLLPASRGANKDAQMLALAVDGAILRAQYEGREAALKPLKHLIGIMKLRA